MLKYLMIIVHQALREALVNTLVHADYTGRSSVLVIKYSDRFYFRNPGLMRIPLVLKFIDNLNCLCI